MNNDNSSSQIQPQGQQMPMLGNPPPLLSPFSNAQPDRLARPARAYFIWGTLILVWLASMLPWRQWPDAPDMMALVIAYWSAYERRRVGLVAAFVFGILLDVHDTGFLGGHALTYTLAAYGALLLYRRLQRFDLWRQAAHMLLVFMLAPLPTQLVEAWLTGHWSGWDWALSALITTALWPIVGWVLQLPQRRLDDMESPSA